MSRKVVYNNCFGGFSLSTEAVLLGRQLSNNPKWGGVVLKGEKWNDGTVNEGTLFDSHHINDDIPRHDPILIQVIETLGTDKASGRFADLVITEVAGLYRISEYDGNETVEEPSTTSWIN